MKARIKNIIDETLAVKTFQLEPETKISYVPGQWMYVRFNESLKHHFTISSSPTEPLLQFTTKFRDESDYKKYLWGMKSGDSVEIKGPFGSFTLDEKDVTPKTFIAGGIGITPFRSMLKYAKDKSLNLPITLLYSVKDKSEVIFSGQIPFTIIETSREGRIDENKIKKYSPLWKESSLWLCGPPAMVEAFVELGQKIGFAPDRIKSEEFTGY